MRQRKGPPKRLKLGGVHLVVEVGARNLVHGALFGDVANRFEAKSLPYGKRRYHCIEALLRFLRVKTLSSSFACI